MRLFLGTSGFSYAPWKGRFYPVDLPQAKMLAFYARRFCAVEINSTFYRMPVASTLAQWRTQVPAGFRFALKCPQRITHARKLVGAEGDLRRLLDVAKTLGGQLGPLLVQLPATQRCDLPRLDDFLAAVPRATRITCEFRHESWFNDQVYATLKNRGAALCIAESDELATPMVATARWGYLRLRRSRYDARMLARRIAEVRAQPWDEVHAFFKHEDTARGPRFAEQWLARWSAG